MKPKLIIALSFFILLPAFTFAGSAPGARPNVIIVLTDDQGWEDVGFNGGKDIHTPHLDALAASGVVFPQGYVSHPYCSPSRAGLLTGRYQQHFGHECNPGYEGYETEDPPGLPLSETLLSQLLKKNGYVTGAIGKWHLGDDPKFWPVNRGFDYWYGFSGGGRSYWSDSDPGSQRALRLNGELQPEEQVSYLTDDFTDDAVEFIKRYKEEPFFLYLAYNAPHGPIHATREYLDRTDYLENGSRSAYAAMIVAVDDGMGKIANELERAGILDNTLIVYLSDNGGHGNGSSCGPYRGWKGMLFEGGIRVPFFMTWPDGLGGNGVYEKPVIALDLFPTILAATNTPKPSDLDLHGVNLIQVLKDPGTDAHETLYWRYSAGKGYAVRHGKYKLVSQHMKPISLFDMDSDPYEHTNLAEELPDVTSELQALYDQWNQDNLDPLWDDPHIPNVEKQENEKRKIVGRACNGEK